ncbi:MAG: hypothetical protein JEY96_01545 [Bacteroidales bacterium]|nr:hypothetical protein [Bacteroidales bacterium]
MIDKLEKLDPDIIADFRKRKESSAIALPLQQFIIHLDRAAELHNLYGNVTKVAKDLVTEFPDEITFQTARQRVYDAINYFHLNNNVKNQAWDNYYADKQEDLARIAIADGNYTTAFKALDKAHYYRTKKDESAIDLELLSPPVFLITPDITVEGLGFGRKDLRKISKKASDGMYEQFIEQMPINKEEKEALKKDANITDVDHEEID